ncbi:glycoside hydrolase family 31 protein [Alteromonas oceanisediminis]|uniref:glycoside hydrolase family 31 protein n=1 Tax=Alteromonas oceanisediminis TaxID=2836180 RepID=UPI001BD9908E|nr:TIM-barrel domain-containing protein [Alteromonas oceanisediminis]MBT0586455.1 DUF5110 domain-containing protein [Alteromonas oceanisediminis]
MKMTLCWLLLCVSVPLHAAIVQSVEHRADALTIVTDEGKVEVRALTAQSVSVWYQPNDVKQLPSFAIDPALDENVSASLQKIDSGWAFTLPNLRVVVQAEPLKLSYEFAGEPLLSEEIGLFQHDTVRGFRFELEPDEKVLGGGQRVLGMDRRGHRMPLYNQAHYGYTTESNQMYFGLSAVMSSDHYSIIFDNSARGTLDIGHTEKDVLQFEAVGGRTAYIVAAGRDYADVVEQVTLVTGRQPLPPRWALGNFASRFGYRTQQEVIDTIDAFVEQDIPVDAVVLDLYWFGPDIKGHMGNLNWHKPTWPDPEGMIGKLKKQGIKTIVITEPFILTSSSQWQSAVSNNALAKNLAAEPRTFDFYFGNTGLVDVFDSNAQDWFWQYYEKLANQGVAGWWGDLGEPEVHPADSLHNVNGTLATADEVHNAYGHQWAKMVYERQLAMAPGQRPFVMMRSGFAGSQRYGMIPWTGDVSREWGGLQSQVELALQMSLFGLAYTHSDLGGFAGGETFDAELYTRWLQLGVFSPVFRPHAQEHIAPEPVFHDDPVKSRARDLIKLRYRLAPYIYALSHENSRTGAPLMRPLAYEFENASIDNTQSFMFGDAFLVTPVVQQGSLSVSLDAPEGVWFNFWSSEKLNGGRRVTVAAPLDEIPVLVKAGAFIPTVPELNNLSRYSTTELVIHYYADSSVSDAQYTFYDDDGVSTNTLSEQKVESITLRARHGEQLQFDWQSEGNFTGRVNQRSVTWVVHGLTAKPKRVLIDGEPAGELLTSSWEAKGDENGVFRVSVQDVTRSHQLILQ